MRPQDVADIEPVRVVKGAGEQRDGYGEANMVQVFLRREAALRDLVDVEGKLCAHMLVRPLGVVHRCAILRGQLGKLLRDRRVDRVRMTDRIAQVVRQRPMANATSSAFFESRRARE